MSRTPHPDQFFCLLTLITSLYGRSVTVQRRRQSENLELGPREGFKNPRHGNFPLGGYGGTAFFAQKTPFLGQFLMDFFLTERGVPPPPLNGQSVTEKLAERGVPPPPSTDSWFPKT